MTPRESIQTFEEISPLEEPGWDAAIDKYASKTLFHERCWLRFLVQSQNARIRGLRFLDGRGDVAGYFCAAEVRRGPFWLLGSPLQGWTTALMGPIVDDVLAGDVVATVDRYCETVGVDYFEIANPVLPAATMRAAGYELDADRTLLVRIDESARMWGRLTSECRNRIRRGERNGLEVERTTDPAFILQYHAQLRDVFLRQGLVPTYGPDRVEALWSALVPAGRLLALRVRKGDEVIGTGLFPFDERAIYFWGGASWTRAYQLCPNELLHWHAMLYALEMGIPVYNMSGAGAFKAKFGGTEVTTERWFKPLSRVARFGRLALKRFLRTRQQVLGRWRQLTALRVVR